MKAITKTQFDKVTKIVLPTMTAKHMALVAEKAGVQPSTVKAIRQAATWDEFERRRAIRADKAKDARQANKALEKSVKGKSARPELVTVKGAKKVQKRHSDKAPIKAAPVKAGNVSPDLKKTGQAVNKALNDADKKRPVKRAVVKRQSKHDVTEEPVPAHLLPQVNLSVPSIDEHAGLSVKQKPSWRSKLSRLFSPLRSSR